MSAVITSDPYDSHHTKVLNGSEFNSLFSDQTFVKLTNRTETHNKFQFVDGLNVDTIQFNPRGNCEPGGIYFTDIRFMRKWIKYGSATMRYMRKVTIPDDAKVYVEEFKFKTDKLFLHPREEISEDVYAEYLKYEFTGQPYQFGGNIFCQTCYDIFYSMHNRHKDREMCLKFVKMDGNILEIVPKNIKDKEICWIAVNQRAQLVQYVPLELRDRDMYILYLKCKGENLKDVPLELRDKELCTIAVTQNGKALEYVPDFIKDTELCMIAVDQDALALKYVPTNIFDRNIWFKCVEKNGKTLEYVPYYLRDEEMCIAAVKDNIKALPNVPYNLRNREMCLSALKKNICMLKYVPFEIMDKELYEIIIDASSLALYYANGIFLANIQSEAECSICKIEKLK